MASDGDLGYFGPKSVSWQVHREVTVLFGGARAVLMQAAHPLVIAGARATGFYERNPWKRLQRTLILTYTITFGTKAEAHAAADRINDVHARIKGVDEVTGQPYDALDPQLLLWVHACLVDSALLFEELTVGKLDDAGRQRFHEEQMLAAEMVKIPREIIPPTVPELRAYMADVIDRGDLRVTDSARKVAELFYHPPAEAEWRPVLKGVSRLAFATLPAPLREEFGIRLGPAKRAAMPATFAATRLARPLLPPKVRYIAPYQEWRLRQQGHRALARGRGSTQAGGDQARAVASPAAPGPTRRYARLARHGRRRTAPRYRRRAGRVVGADRREPSTRSSWIRDRGLPFRLITNTTTHTREALAGTLRDAGFAVEPADIVTAVVATAAYLRDPLPGARVFLLSDGDAREDLEGITLVGPRRAGRRRRDRRRLRRLHLRHRQPHLPAADDGAALVGMHRNMYWRTADGLQLDGGAYIAGARGGRPASRRRSAGSRRPRTSSRRSSMLGVPADPAAMVGDDVVNDVLGAQAIGMTGVLVRTGKFRPADLERDDGTPDHVIDSFADLPTLLRTT